MRLELRNAAALLSVLMACELPEPMLLGDEPDASEDPHLGHEMDAGSMKEDGGVHAHDAGSDASEHAGFGLHVRPSNITCVAPSYVSPSASDGGVQELMPEKLSETGCFDPTDPSKPYAGLLPFDLNSPLWSDGADKKRWMALPSGAKITVIEGGDFDFPPGTMLVKEFSLGGRRLETRFFAHHPVHGDGGVAAGQWVGYTYEWNAEQTEAFLVPAGPTTPFDVDPNNAGLGQWQVPNRDECMTCHTVAANRSLGPEVGQLNRSYTYESTGTTSNQLATLDHIGMFTEPLPAIETLAKLASPEDQASDVDQRARAYLHANCSFCHRKPDGLGGGPDEFRASVPFEMMGICDVAPTIASAVTELGMDPSKAKILAHMSPPDSVMWKRMQARGPFQMPPIGSKKADMEGLNLIAQWINSITECPAPPSAP